MEESSEYESKATKKELNDVTHSDSTIDIVIIGGGPVGLFFAKELKKKKKNYNILILERYNEYSRHHFVKIEKHYLNTHTATHVFFKLASSATPLAYTSTISPTKTMSIMDLENVWRNEAIERGVQIRNEMITDPISLEQRYPNAHAFIGADGSKSITRKEIFGDEKSLEHDFQYMIELKYKIIQISSNEDIHMSSSQIYKTQKILNFYMTEYIRHNEDIIIRFLVDSDTHESLPNCTFRTPLNCESQFHEVPTKLQHDIRCMMNIRKDIFNEEYISGTCILTKTTLGIYKSSSVACKPGITETDKSIRRHWYLIGDAAMGVPFFRSLNAGLEGSNKLIDILTDAGVYLLGKKHGLDLAVTRHNTFYGLLSFREGSEAFVKSEGLNTMANSLHAIGSSPLQIKFWSQNDINKFSTDLHPALGGEISLSDISI
jgi:hypothetical protein